ncbi:MAG: DUF768 domain-containing protein [Mesorhizobium sp.]|nr:MAG: DUF768 domain-containing protein [Mesorhizobium sp.]
MPRCRVSARKVSMSARALDFLDRWMAEHLPMR